MRSEHPLSFFRHILRIVLGFLVSSLQINALLNFVGLVLLPVDRLIVKDCSSEKIDIDQRITDTVSVEAMKNRMNRKVSDINNNLALINLNIKTGDECKIQIFTTDSLAMSRINARIANNMLLGAENEEPSSFVSPRKTIKPSRSFLSLIDLDMLDVSDDLDDAADRPGSKSETDSTSSLCLTDISFDENDISLNSTDDEQ